MFESTSVFYFVPLMHVSVPPIPHCFDSCSYMIGFNIGWSNFFYITLLFQDGFIYSSVLPFQINFKISLSISIKHAAENLIETALSLEIRSGKIGILAVLFSSM